MYKSIEFDKIINFNTVNYIKGKHSNQFYNTNAKKFENRKLRYKFVAGASHARNVML